MKLQLNVSIGINSINLDFMPDNKKMSHFKGSIGPYKCDDSWAMVRNPLRERSFGRGELGNLDPGFPDIMQKLPYEVYSISYK